MEPPTVEGTRETLGALIQRQRLAARLTQEELAERAHLSARSIRNLERGSGHIPRFETLRLLAPALRLSEADTARLWAAARADPRTSEPPPGTVQLPTPLTHLIGREPEVATLTSALSGQGVRLLTLVGPGGVGKTRLALEVARRAAEDFADGICHVALEHLRDAALVPAALAGALRLREADTRPIEEIVRAHIGERRLLLLFDTFEHVLAAATAVVGLLETCPRCAALVTSRAPLHVCGERVFEVQPLAVPPAELPLSEEGMAALTTFPAVALLLDRAWVELEAPALAPSAGGAIAAISRRLGGLPLAIELAAPWLRLLSAQELLCRLDNALDLLTDGPRDLPARHRTLRATLDWTHELLAPEEQAIFRRLAVFAGGCTLDAAEQVCGRPGGAGLERTATRPILDSLFRLVDHHLLRREELADGDDVGGSTVRLGMLETVREYAVERLRVSGEEEEAATLRAHAWHYCALVEIARPQFLGPHQRTWLDRVEADLDNVRAALAWAERRGEVELGLRIATALAYYMDLRGLLSEGRRWLDAFLALVGGMEARVTPAVRANALNAAGFLALYQGDLNRANLLFDESLVLRRTIGDKAAIAASLNNLALLAKQRGDLERAAALLEESLTIRREIGDEQGIVASLMNLGNVQRRRGWFAEARTRYSESLHLYRTLGDQQGAATALGSLGRVALDLGDAGAAAAYEGEALALLRWLGDQRGVAATLVNLGDVACARGDIPVARDLCRQGLQAHHDLGIQEGMAASLEGWAAAEALAGAWDRVALLCSVAARLRAAIQAPLPEGDRRRLDQIMERAREHLGSERWTAMRARGEATTIEQAIAGPSLGIEEAGEGADHGRSLA